MGAAPGSPVPPPPARGSKPAPGPPGAGGGVADLADPTPRGERLEAAAEPAGAARPAGLEDDVADLPGQAPRPAVEHPVDHDAGGDPRADAQVGEVGAVAGDVARVEPGGGGADVVLDRDRDAEALLQPGTQRQLVPAEVDRERDRPVAGLDPTRDPDADREQVVLRQAGRGEGRLECVRDPVDGVARIARAGRDDVRPSGTRSRSARTTAILLPPTSIPARTRRVVPSVVVGVARPVVAGVVGLLIARAPGRARGS